MLGRAAIGPGLVGGALLLLGALAPTGCGQENTILPPQGPPAHGDAGVDAARDSEKAGDASADGQPDRADVNNASDVVDSSDEPGSGIPEGGGDGEGGDAEGGPVTGPGCGGCFADELLSAGQCFTNASCGSPHHAVMLRMNGGCQIHSCHPGWGDCDGKADTGCEADLSRPENCMRCGNLCPAGQLCASTGCITTCAPPAIDCSGACVDTSSSPDHCTACFMACPEPQWHRPTCTAGVCGSELICPPGASPCGKGCNVLDEDPTNCGSCGHSCAVPAGGSVSCRGGTCTPHCPAGFTFCDNACVDLQADPANCGTCGRACAMGGCVAGACDPSWSAVVATGTAPTGLAIDDTSVYWLESAAGMVMKAPKAGGAPMMLATGQASPFALAIDGTHVYWSNRTGNAIMRIAKAGGSAPELVVTVKDPTNLVTDGMWVYYQTPPTPVDAGTTGVAEEHGPPPVLGKVRIGTSIAEPFWEFPNGDTDAVLGGLLVDGINVYWSGRRYTVPGNYFTFLIDKELGATLRSYAGNWGELTMDGDFLYMTTGAGTAGVPMTVAAIAKSNGKGGAILQFQPGGAYAGGGHMVAGDTYLYRSSSGEFNGVHKVLKCGLQNVPVNLTRMDRWSYLVTDNVYIYGVIGAEIRRIHH